MANFEFDPEQLKADQDAALEQKRNLALIGGIGDVLGSSQGFGNFYLGKMNPQSQTGARTADTIASTIQDPIERQGKLYSAYKNSIESKQLKDEQERTARLKDPNSKESMALKALVANKPKWGIRPTPEMSAYEIQQLINAPKMMETEASSAIEFDKARRLKEIEMGNERMKEGMRLDREAREKAAKEAADRKDRSTIYGVARTPDDAKKLKDASELKATLDAQINELISLREKYGAEVVDRDAVSRAQQLAKNLLLTKKNMESLGVLSKSDEAIVNEIIPADPLQFNFSQLVGQDPTMTKLKSFRDDTNRDFQERLKNRIENYQPQEYALTEKDRKAMQWAMQNPNDERAAKILTNIQQKYTAVGSR